ncbi:MAG: helix-turn-helix domain-containing protein [Lachnospiraceae bacterium]|nr:helix-turn-helix domain-containing protein [Lachnospiraceae bacterium]
MRNQLRSAFNTRQHMISRDFEIFYYSDVNFNPVPAHAHNYYEFYLIVEGEISMEIGRQTFPIQVGDLILVPPGIQHHLILHSPEKPYRRFVFWISQNYVQELLEQSPDYVYLMQQAATGGQYIYHIPTDGLYSVQSRILRLIEEIHSDRYGKSAAVTIAVNDLILQMNRLIYEEEHENRPAETQDLLQNLLAYIESHIEGDLSLDELADQFYVSKYYLSHLFQENLGVSAHRYITKKRLSACRDAILSGAPISRVCFDYGFREYSSFYRAFCKEYGMSPKEYAAIYRS